MPPVFVKVLGLPFPVQSPEVAPGDCESLGPQEHGGGGGWPLCSLSDRGAHGVYVAAEGHRTHREEGSPQLSGQPLHKETNPASRACW